MNILVRKKRYIASIKVPIVDLTFDDFQYGTDSIEKTKLILKYVFNFLYFNLTKILTALFTTQ